MARLIHEDRATDWALTVVRALIVAEDRMRANVESSARAAGLSMDTPTKEVGGARLWDQARWASVVESEVVPATTRVARDIVAHLRRSVPRAAHAGMPDPTPAMVDVVRMRAVRFGPTIAKRMGSRAPIVGLAAAGVDMDKVRAMLEAAPDLRGGVATVGSAYQQAYDALDQLVASSSSAMAQAGVAAIGQAAADNTGADVTHTWNCAFVELSREDHMDADGQVQAAGDPFDIGGEDAMYPGDPDLSDGQACNCLCWLTTDGITGATDDEG